MQPANTKYRKVKELTEPMRPNVNNPLLRLFVDQQFLIYGSLANAAAFSNKLKYEEFTCST